MARTSEHDGYIDWDAADVGGDLPVRTGLSRDSVLNSALHSYDMSGQCLVNWVPPTTAGELQPVVVSTDTPSFVGSFGPWPLVVRADGTTAPIVVRLGIRLTQVATGTFYAALIPERRGIAAGLFPTPRVDGPQVCFATTTQTSLLWTDPNPDFVQLGPDHIAEATVRHATLLRPAPGNRDEVRVVQAQLEVYAITDDVLAIPVLGGVYAREFVSG